MTIDRSGWRFIAIVLASLTAAACSQGGGGGAASLATTAKPASPLSVAWQLPVSAGMQPDLKVAPDGALLLSWVEETGGTRRLRFSRWARAHWTSPATIASGDWFGNSFDTPRIEQTQDGAVWATWMRKSQASGHSRDVVIARSSDGGATWSRPVAVNTDGTPTEHGFVSLWRAANDAVGVAWLDGRAKHGGDMHAMHGSSSAEMQMLRSAVFDARLQRRAEGNIDATVCDCCHTAIATPTAGPVLVYRDRTTAEVRDVHAAILRNGAWRDTGAVHADHWVMPGCPVNGPAVAASGNHVLAAWYTAPGGVPTMRYASSNDGGLRFGEATTLSRDASVLGRVAVAMDTHTAWIGFVTETSGTEALMLSQREFASSQAPAPVTLTKLSTHGQGAGMPRLAASGGSAYVVWTDSVGGVPHLVGRRISSRP